MNNVYQLHKVVVYRLKSDNYDCYVCPRTYRAITLTMSTGDYGAHRAKRIELDGDTLNRIMSDSKQGYICKLTDEEGMFEFYDGSGDCEVLLEEEL